MVLYVLALSLQSGVGLCEAGGGAVLSFPKVNFCAFCLITFVSWQVQLWFGAWLMRSGCGVGLHVFLFTPPCKFLCKVLSCCIVVFYLLCEHYFLIGVCGNRQELQIKFKFLSRFSEL